MKTILFTFFTFFCLPLFAQTRKDVKLYGYIQAVIAGAVPRSIIDESGQERPSEYKPRYNYLFYLTSPSGVRVYPTEVWLKGKQYKAKWEAVPSTPVQFTNHNIPNRPTTITLVPKTGASVLSITPSTGPITKVYAGARKIAAANELVVVYRMQGKFYYARLPKVTELEPAVMQ